jgi:SAM-dependent methyltransferase
MHPASLYNSARLAAGYARSRPPVHARIMDAVRRRFAELGIEPARLALDLGCGAGLSTAALEPLAARAVGLEPSLPMLAHHSEVAPHAAFVAGRAEELPFRDGVFDLLAAAGSLNYTNLALVLPEAARVLGEDGAFIIYDFSAGRRLVDDPRLDRWFASFERRYPFPPGYAMDVTELPFTDAGLRLVRHEEFQVSVPMTGEAYEAYVMSETNVERAVADGAPEGEIAAWCRQTLGEIFERGARDVLFDAYVAYVRPALLSAA